MVDHRLLSILGRARNSKEAYGCSPYFAATALTPSSQSTSLKQTICCHLRIHSDYNRPDCAQSYYFAEKTRPACKATRQVYSARVQAAIRFEKEHAHTIKDFDFKLGDLVLVRNTAIEKLLT